MIDLKQSPTDGPTMLSDQASEPAYPYGTCLRLDGDTLRKLGIGTDSLPQVGQEFAVQARVVVTEVSKHAETTEPETSVELQVTHMQIGNDQQRAHQQVGAIYGRG